jgi:cation/acetate symporter
MAFTSRTRLVNPRLGTYFGIFAAAFAAIVLMAMMLEQLGATDALVRLTVFASPILLYAGIGVMSATREPQDYFACGRRVPAFFNGLALGIAALGGAGFLALTGAFFIIGFDALCLSIGWYAGLVFATLLFVPFFRKVGAFTVPTFLGRRFDSRTVRVVAAGVLSVPILLLLAAEARFAAYASAWLLGQSERLTAVLVVSCAAAIVIAGGMRSLTWTSAAQGIAALLALAVPATIVAVMVSNLPLPQMTHGNVLRALSRVEVARNLPIIVAPNWAVELPAEGIEMLGKRMLQAFGSVGGIGFIIMSFVVATGIAASPTLLPRSGTTPGVYEARKSGGWAVLVVGLVLLTLPAVAVYLRSFVLDQVVNMPPDRLPVWFQLLQQAGIARIDARAPLVRARQRRLRARRRTVCAADRCRPAAGDRLPVAGGRPRLPRSPRSPPPWLQPPPSCRRTWCTACPTKPFQTAPASARRVSPCWAWPSSRSGWRLRHPPIPCSCSCGR